MKEIIKKIHHTIGIIIGKIIYIIPTGDIIYDGLIANAFGRIRIVKNGQKIMKFTCPNRLTKKRVESFYKKEPETIKWIDSFEKNSIFFDVGANIGLYSIYAGINNHKVYAFEPSILNIEMLARNIDLNNLEDICICAFPLSENTEVAKMELSKSEWGGALSTFNYGIDQNGNKFKALIKYSMLGFSLDDLIEKEILPQPKYLKIDVDGIEHYILKGGINTLKKCTHVLIEVNSEFMTQITEVNKIMKSLGFNLHRADQLGRINQSNLIWIK